MGNNVVKHLTSWSPDKLVKLTMLWTMGPDIYAVFTKKKSTKNQLPDRVNKK